MNVDSNMLEYRRKILQQIYELTWINIINCGFTVNDQGEVVTQKSMDEYKHPFINPYNVIRIRGLRTALKSLKNVVTRHDSTNIDKFKKILK